MDPFKGSLGFLLSSFVRQGTLLPPKPYTLKPNSISRGIAAACCGHGCSGDRTSSPSGGRWRLSEIMRCRVWGMFRDYGCRVLFLWLLHLPEPDCMTFVAFFPEAQSKLEVSQNLGTFYNLLFLAQNASTSYYPEHSKAYKPKKPKTSTARAPKLWPEPVPHPVMGTTRDYCRYSKALISRPY